jgi:hypothetical protein
MTFQESDCTFTAVAHKSKSDTHSLRLKTKDVRADADLKPSNAILLGDAVGLMYVTTSRPRLALSNFVVAPAGAPRQPG